MAEKDEQFTRIKGFPGKIYAAKPRGKRKHPCADCFECQFCSDSRCAECRNKTEKDESTPCKKPDFPEEPKD